jgi:hypothetical protein
MTRAGVGAWGVGVWEGCSICFSMWSEMGCGDLVGFLRGGGSEDMGVPLRYCRDGGLFCGAVQGLYRVRGREEVLLLLLGTAASRITL